MTQKISNLQKYHPSHLNVHILGCLSPNVNMDWLIILVNEPFEFTDRSLVLNQRSRETSRSKINSYSLAAVWQQYWPAILLHGRVLTLINTD